MEPWTGGCLCGAIRYEVAPSEVRNWYCHCRMCQRWTGSVVGADALVPKSDFRITSGEPKYYRSSAFAKRGFCSDCGSPLIFWPIEDDWLGIQIGTLDDPEVAPPSGHFGIEGKISWLSLVDDLEQVRTEDDDWYKERSKEQGGH